MISASNQLKTVLKQNASIRISAGCTAEYNMNLMTNLTSANVTGPAYATVNGKESFKKIFPLDTIIKPNRPAYAGIKYAIFGDISLGYNSSTRTGGDYRSPKDTTYPLNYRTYYPGIDTAYKYWISSEGQGGTITIAYPKTVVTNKIVVKFEISHATPPSYTVYKMNSGSQTAIFSGTSSDIPAFGSSKPGVLTLYYTGNDWTTNAANHNVGTTTSIDGIRITFTGVSGKYIGITEFSARWVKDISQFVVDMDISKESSSSSTDILPVGQISANSLSIALNNYNSSSMQILTYDKSSTSAFDTSKIYLYKNIEMVPFFDIYHDNGSLGTAPNKYDRIVQGTFYADSWKVNEYNDASVVALDGAKILQETLCPPVLCESYSVTAIIRRLLDNIGFTNYAFNLATNDQSVISPNYWWADDNKTVWQALQELCRDTQMTAVFDENNILQFYSRDYMYSSRTTVWQFDSIPNSNDLPDIISLDKQELPSANQVKILWQSAVTSNYERDSEDIWKSDTTFLGAAALTENLDTTNVVEGSPLAYISLEPLTTTGFEEDTILYSFSGYLAVEDEIIEYDAIRYQYNPLDPLVSSPQYIDITSDSDIFKYRALAQPGSQNFKPVGKYRIKNRGAFGSTINSHMAGTTAETALWSIREVQLD